MKKAPVLQMVDDISYALIEKSKILPYILAIANKEWEPNDFIKYGDDLNISQWILKIVSISEIKEQPHLMESQTFQEDLEKRIMIQRNLFAKQKPLTPIILRGSDYLLFDGYARVHFLQELGIKRVLAYVGYRS